MPLQARYATFFYWGVLTILLATGCKKNNPIPGPTTPTPVSVTAVSINGTALVAGTTAYNKQVNSSFTITLTNKVNRSTVATAISLMPNNGTPVPLQFSYQKSDSVIIASPVAPLQHLSKYSFKISTALQAVSTAQLTQASSRTFITAIDSSAKFPQLTDEELLTKVQQQTFRYFWDFAHPVSGLARERNTSGDIVTSGGSGFGIMCIPVAVSRNFITRAQGLARMQQIVSFLKNTAQSFHGAFPHWINGSTGAVVPFSSNDNGADLVETAYLMAGLLTARQFFNSAETAEIALRNDINTLYNNVEWSWFRQNNQDMLYWHWSPAGGWIMNMPIRGWNECLITYIMAAASPTHAVPASVYRNGFARNGDMRNGNSYYGYPLPLGPEMGGPLFWAQYSFLGINPNGLSDSYADYKVQTQNHTLINYQYCQANPHHYFGYSNQCWGLTASDISGGYTASSPVNDVGVIAPTAALSSFPYTPAESMQALRFFYYTLGNKLWKEYGFVDAFSLNDLWYADSFLAIDQGPVIIMIENFRSGQVWNLFTSCPEVKSGMRALGFTAPYL